ncbi:cytochrome P450 2J6 [Trichonephila inaurata madagascariensis]|uniref:Cytochrome P450 2J6 n=1 Tax=Trichonephila inaurata madagascariensis TaxID=2747483 RepID=A0A8X7BQW9_9ARAC|nr:cytochrome P450 2J6 [Trichonephila inaurata madagascariensis]
MAGFSGQNGEAWQEQRRFVVQTMRNLGLGKGLWETMIQDDSAMLVKEIQKANGEPFAFNEPLAMSQISNSLSLLFGRHLDPEAEKDDIEVMRESSRKMMDHVSSVDINIILPWLTKLMMLFNVLNYQDFINLLRKMEDIFKKEVEKRINTKEELTKDDFIGCYLQEIEKRKNDSQPHNFNGTIFELKSHYAYLFRKPNDYFFSICFHLNCGSCFIRYITHIDGEMKHVLNS